MAKRRARSAGTRATKAARPKTRKRPQALGAAPAQPSKPPLVRRHTRTLARVRWKGALPPQILVDWVPKVVAFVRDHPDPRPKGYGERHIAPGVDLSRRLGTLLATQRGQPHASRPASAEALLDRAYGDAFAVRDAIFRKTRRKTDQGLRKPFFGGKLLRTPEALREVIGALLAGIRAAEPGTLATFYIDAQTTADLDQDEADLVALLEKEGKDRVEDETALAEIARLAGLLESWFDDFGTAMNIRFRRDPTLRVLALRNIPRSRDFDRRGARVDGVVPPPGTVVPPPPPPKV
jgi:hypothetical protein